MSNFFPSSSSFRIEPVSRSPFLRVIWSACATATSRHNENQDNTRVRRMCDLLAEFCWDWFLRGRDQGEAVANDVMILPEAVRTSYKFVSSPPQERTSRIQLFILVALHERKIYAIQSA